MSNRCTERANLQVRTVGLENDVISVSNGVLLGDALHERARHGPPHIALWPQHDDVHLGREKTHEQHRGADADGEAQRREPHLDTTRRRHVDGHERQPHHARRVHRQADVT